MSSSVNCSQNNDTSIVCLGGFCPDITDAKLRSEIGRSHNWNYLSLRNCTQITEAGLRVILNLHSLPQMSGVILAGCSQFTEMTLVEILLHNPFLEFLDLSNCTKITDVGLKVVLTSKPWPCLQWIDLTGCHQITDQTRMEITRHLKNLDIFFMLRGIAIHPDYSGQVIPIRNPEVLQKP
jgi:hypothetical protein